MTATPRPISKAGSWYVVILIAIISVIAYIDRLALALLVDPIRAELGVTDTQIGLLIGPSFAILFTVAAFPAARIADRRNRKRLLAAGIALWSATTIASAFAPNFYWLLAFRMGIGIGEAVLHPVAVSMIGDLFERDRRPTPIGIYIASGAAGSAGSFIIVAAILQMLQGGNAYLPDFLLSMAPWRIVFFSVGVPGIVLAAVFALTVREPVRGLFGEKSTNGEAAIEREAFASRGGAVRFYAPFLIGINIVIMVSFIATSWYPTFVMRNLGATPSETGYLFGTLTMIGSLAGTLGIPILSEFIGRRGRKDSIIALALIVMPVGLIAFVSALLVENVVLGIVLIAVFKAFNNGVAVTGSVVIASLGTSANRGKLTAISLAIQCFFSLTLGPVMVPFIARTAFGGDIGPAMLSVAVVAIPLAFLLILSAWKPYRSALSGLAKPVGGSALS